MPASPPPKLLNVHLLPDLANPHELAGHVLVVIDVLRATTTLTAALAAGAERIVPCLEVNEARQLAHDRPAGLSVLLGGERQGKSITGFDLGNSPSEYTADRVGGRTIVMTTTNGTRAMMRCVGAGRVLIGSFVNLSAVVRQLTDLPRVELICAGTDRQISWEDTLLAGAIVDRLGRQAWQWNDSARLAWHAWQHVGGFAVSHPELVTALSTGRGGQNLIGIQRADDIAWAARIDTFDVVPELDLADWVIVNPDRARGLRHRG
jgi:2-phosphosulfolactate phosphatase